MEYVEFNKRRSLATSIKVNIIRALERGMTNNEISLKFQLPVSTVSTIWKNREKIMKDFRERNSNFKRSRNCKLHHVSDALFEWYKVKRDQNIPVTRADLMVQASKLAKEKEGCEEIKISHSWIERFKVRHNVELKKAPRFGRDPDSLVQHWISEVRTESRKCYGEDDIFIITEMGLFYDLRPDKLDKYENAACNKGELAQERVTVFSAINFSGTEKRKLLVVGECRKIKRLKTVKNLPVNYEVNENSWMTPEIFQTELLTWDAELKKKNNKVLVLVPRSHAQCNIKNLTNIDLLIFPANVEFLLKSISAGIIRQFKFHYRKNMIVEFYKNTEYEDSDGTISLLTAIRLMAESWILVCAEEIRNSFIASEIFKNGNNLFLFRKITLC